MRLRLARFGGAFMLAGGLTFLVVLAMVLGNQPVGTGMNSVGGWTFDLGLAFLAVAAIVLAAAGEGPLSASGTRAGLLVMAAGITLVLASSVAMRLLTDPWTPAIVQVLLGIPATIIGFLVLGVSLVRQDGPPKLVGKILLAGLALLLLTVIPSVFGDFRLNAFAAPMGTLAAALVATSLGGIGYLAMRDRWSWR